jgi:hypothetical protein
MIILLVRISSSAVHSDISESWDKIDLITIRINNESEERKTKILDSLR